MPAGYHVLTVLFAALTAVCFSCTAQQSGAPVVETPMGQKKVSIISEVSLF